MTKRVITAPAERLQFASDNASGICPEAWSAIERANSGPAPAYGEDEWTERACDLMRELMHDHFFSQETTAGMCRD